MKLIKTEDAEGHVLCHDMTRIIKDVQKDAVFRKGHIVLQEDIPVLLSMGKEHLYVWEKQEGFLHENEAAALLCEMCLGPDMVPSEVKEGKIDILASEDGLFKVNAERLYRLNSLGEIMIATRHGNTPVRKGDKLAGTRIIPLIIEKEKMDRAKAVCGAEPLLKLLPFRLKKAGIIATGNEVEKGRIADTFTPVIIEKLAEYGAEAVSCELSGDDGQRITALIKEMIEHRGVDFVICTGGMSVDPDDRTPAAIRNTGAGVVSYGAPVLPGAMFMLAYYQEQYPVLGLPGCVMYARRTVFDLVLPRILAEDPITAVELAALGEGGLCLNCGACVWPDCGFGKGVYIHEN